jgi:hypothetical protein
VRQSRLRSRCMRERSVVIPLSSLQVIAEKTKELLESPPNYTMQLTTLRVAAERDRRWLDQWSVRG